jgi:carboxyl-terminal processing protease
LVFLEEQRIARDTSTVKASTDHALRSQRRSRAVRKSRPGRSHNARLAAAAIRDDHEGLTRKAADVEPEDVTLRMNRESWIEPVRGERAGSIATAALLVAVLTAPLCAQAAVLGVQERAWVDASIAVASFDSAWVRIRDTHYDTLFASVDWQAVRADLRPRAASARTIGELRVVLSEMLGRLGESHYSLIPSEAAGAVDPGHVGEERRVDGPSGDAGMELRLAGDDLVVWRVDTAGPAALAGVRAGWIVERLEGERVDEAIARLEGVAEGWARRNALMQFLWSARSRLEGPAGTSVVVEFLDGANAPVTRARTRRPRPGEAIRFGNLPTFMAELSYTRIATATGCVGVIRFNVWMVPLVARFDRAMDEVRSCEGIVIDLRGNPGGLAGMVMGVSGHFLNERVALGTMHARGTHLNFVANPRRVDSTGQPVSPYAGPLAILIDGLSVSTSEFFAGGMQAVGRARIFGERTPGQALPATLMRLPSGDVLMYVVADFTAPDGTRIEGRGIIPDETVPLRRAMLLARRDEAFDAALEWLRDRAQPGATQVRSRPR